MKRLLLLGVLAAAVLVPAATASPATTHTLRGTVVAKDRVHRALVVALPGGRVQTLVAPAAFARTGIGRRVVIRYTGLAGQLPVALGVTLGGHAHHAVVRGTIVRLVKRHALINAGGSVLNVTLKAPKGQRVLASASSGPKVGDTVKVEVEIDDDDSLDASAIVVTAAPAGQSAVSEGEMEVRGTVTLLAPPVPGTLTVTTGTSVVVTCFVPTGATLNVTIGELIELECDLILGKWTVRVARGEDDHSGSDENSGSGGDDSSKVEVRGTISVAILPTAATVSVLRQGSLTDVVTCAIVPGSLTQFALGDAVKMECVMVGTTLTLREIEKKDGNAGEQSGDDDGGDGGDSGGSNDESGSGGSDD